MRIASAALASVFLLTGCVTTSTRTTELGGPAAESADWERPGHVERAREIVRRSEGDPAGGALAGALVGGFLGGIIGGHDHYDRYGYGHRHFGGAGAMIGAVGGAMVGAAASQGSAEERTHEILVRFDDGSARRFVFAGPIAFRIGEPVALTRRGLERR
jgi:outer membrane lipoprotein SlyB